MKRCVIFCGGGFSSLDGPILDTDLVIAADKGLDYTRQLGLNPQIVLGDFDSLGYIPAGAEVHPVEKDDTDAMLAVRRGLDGRRPGGSHHGQFPAAVLPGGPGGKRNAGWHPAKGHRDPKFFHPV